MRKHLVIKGILAGVLVVGVVVLLAETLIVKVQTTYLRKQPAYYAPTLAALKAGEALTRIEARDGWLKVRTSRGLEGWVHSSALQTRRFRLAALEKSLQTRATTEEVALAGKGFNKQVEKAYRARHKSLSFAEVDRMLKLKVSPEQLRRFLEKGRLGDFGGTR
ncbi:MAG: SH3 domain-containing protein [Candidatus Aminicenantales bacterium]